MAKKLRWGILGLGGIARKFADALSFVEDANLAAVGSRNLEKAKTFAAEFKADRFYGSYEELVADPQVDAIYIATPHNLHCENTIMALNAGKHVLCEKPFAVNAKQARQMIDCARKNKKFCMEAMWTRFLPSIAQVREMLAHGVIGEVRVVQADFGFRSSQDETSRILAPQLAGGALLDVGIYPLAFAFMVLGKPQSICSTAHIGRTRVDVESAAILSYSDGKFAIISCACRVEMPQQAWIMGTQGMIALGSGWWHGSDIILRLEGRPEQVIQVPTHQNGFVYEIQEVHRRIAEGSLESPTMPLDETLELAHTMDAIRAQWPMKYPFE
jgi:dihydrodiol dehydrogenase / D-xylose 1-dehydrogenase (NADP)